MVLFYYSEVQILVQFIQFHDVLDLQRRSDMMQLFILVAMLLLPSTAQGADNRFVSWFFFHLTIDSVYAHEYSHNGITCTHSYTQTRTYIHLTGYVVFRVIY